VVRGSLAFMEEQSLKVSKELLVKLRKIASREGYVLKRLVERLIESGIKAEGLK
jgi:hypothetical protein